MAARRKSVSHALAVQAAELAVAVPQVVAHRVTLMALAGPRVTARDRREFEVMVAEKNAAFGESWSAMATEMARANQRLAASMVQSFWSVALGKRPSVVAASARFNKAAIGVVSKGVAPVHRKAVANAKRLARTKLR